MNRKEKTKMWGTIAVVVISVLVSTGILNYMSSSRQESRHMDLIEECWNLKHESSCLHGGNVHLGYTDGQ